MRKYWIGLLVALALAPLVGCSGGSQDSNRADAQPVVGGGSGSGQCSLCSQDQGCCDGFCIDIQDNPSHCGACNAACDSMTANSCSGGFCACNYGPTCGGGDACCDAGCRDLSSDGANCGACGNVCADSEECQGGVCVCAAAGAVCAPDEACCATGCVGLQSDRANCGACGNACGGSETCQLGACVCPYTCPFDPGFGTNIVCCDDGCFDLCNDAANCGACGNACGAGETCALGACPDGLPDIFSCLFASP
jgi:hypothetical protein